MPSPQQRIPAFIRDPAPRRGADPAPTALTRHPRSSRPFPAVPCSLPHLTDPAALSSGATLDLPRGSVCFPSHGNRHGVWNNPICNQIWICASDKSLAGKTLVIAAGAGFSSLLPKANFHVAVLGREKSVLISLRLGFNPVCQIYFYI